MKKIKEQPKEMEGIYLQIYLQAVLMPNGEVICGGRTIGVFKKLKEFIYK